MVAHDPSTLLIDEPFGALDARLKLVMQAGLTAIWKESRKTVVFVIYDIAEAVALADRVVVFTTRPGRVQSVHEIDLPRPRARRSCWSIGVRESISTERERGFAAGLAAHGLTLTAREMGRFSYVGGRDAALRLAGRADRPDAAFCANGGMALGLVDAARATFGLRIPQDLSVIGFDDTPSAALASCRLTTVARDVAQLAEPAVSAVQERAGPLVSTARDRLIPCRLVQRDPAGFPGTRGIHAPGSGSDDGRVGIAVSKRRDSEGLASGRGP